MGPGDPRAGDRRRPGPTGVAVATARRAAADRQLRVLLPRPRGWSAAARACASTWSCWTSRSGSRTAPAPPARWSAASPAAELGPDRHARGKQRRRPGRHLRVPGPRLPLAGDEAPQHGPHGQRSRPPPDQGSGPHRTAAQAVPRRRAGTDARAARGLPAGRGRGRGPPDRDGRAATIQHVFELVLRLKQICNFDPATGASSKLERLEADLEEIATQRPQGDRLQPMGRNDRAAGRALARSARWSTTAAFPAPPRRRHPAVPRRPAAATCC